MGAKLDAFRPGTARARRLLACFWSMVRGAKWSEFRTRGWCKTLFGWCKTLWALRDWTTLRGPMRKAFRMRASSKRRDTVGFFRVLSKVRKTPPTQFCASSTDQVRLIIGCGFCESLPRSRLARSGNAGRSDERIASLPCCGILHADLATYTNPTRQRGKRTPFPSVALRADVLTANSFTRSDVCISIDCGQTQGSRMLYLDARCVRKGGPICSVDFANWDSPRPGASCF